MLMDRSGTRAFLSDSYQAARDLAKRVVLPVIRPRRLDVCCCGLSKTGTHSLAGIFENYRSEHHPDADVRLPLAAAFLKGEVDSASARKILRRRDALLRLEVESSSLAGILIEPLAAACPDKKFILTIRDVYSWCDSWIDHNINQPPVYSSPWATLDRVRLRIGDFRETKFDAPLVAHGFPPLGCYFQLWAGHNNSVLESVPQRRLLIVRTKQIVEQMPQIAAWAGVPAGTLRNDRNWLFAAPKKHRVLAMLDRAYVQDMASQHCGSLMKEHFPEVTWT